MMLEIVEMNRRECCDPVRDLKTVQTYNPCAVVFCVHCGIHWDELHLEANELRAQLETTAVVNGLAGADVEVDPLVISDSFAPYREGLAPYREGLFLIKYWRPRKMPREDMHDARRHCERLAKHDKVKYQVLA
jgi:hypothetical protein